MLPSISKMTTTCFLICTHQKLLFHLVKAQNRTGGINHKLNYSTVLQDEVSKHTKLAKEWWDPKGPMKALLTLNSVRIPFMKSSLINIAGVHNQTINKENPLEKLKILDVGCGGGLLSESLARLGATVTGIDPSEELINVARHHAAQNLDKPPEYIVTNIENYHKENCNKFDVVVISEVLEHVENKPLFLKLALNTLKPAGSLFITTPQKSLLSFFGTIVAAEYILNLVPRGTHNYSQFITPQDLVRTLLPLRALTFDIVGLNYNPFTNRWSLGRTPIFNYALHAVKTEAPMRLSHARSEVLKLDDYYVKYPTYTEEPRTTPMQPNRNQSNSWFNFNLFN